MKNLCADCCENEALCNSKLCGLNVTTTYQTDPLPSTTPVTTSSVTQSPESTTIAQPNVTRTITQPTVTTAITQHMVTTTIPQSKVTTTIAQPKVTTTPSVTTATTATTSELILAPPLINGTISLNVHGNGRLDCVSGRNDVSFAWQFNGTSSIPQHVHVFRNHLLIVSMTEAEVGMYTCIISHLETTAQVSTWLSMNAEKPHVAFVVASPSHPWTHHRVDIHCSVTGYPDPDIFWSFMDTMGLSYVPINVSYPDRATVRIDDFEPSLHSGKWSCIARNIIGVDNDFVQI
ncbi:hypothetical protein ACJMK2_025228 [Sinanodonta woodiana]|uniref:Ig-like domain-containing protein n=1 Tax=Sinanodonta woodiana TaxID=1069815 RepID=A0ABD3XJN5_SINWO